MIKLIHKPKRRKKSFFLRLNFWLFCGLTGSIYALFHDLLFVIISCSVFLIITRKELKKFLVRPIIAGQQKACFILSLQLFFVIRLSWIRLIKIFTVSQKYNRHFIRAYLSCAFNIRRGLIQLSGSLKKKMINSGTTFSHGLANAQSTYKTKKSYCQKLILFRLARFISNFNSQIKQIRRSLVRLFVRLPVSPARQAEKIIPVIKEGQHIESDVKEVEKEKTIPAVKSEAQKVKIKTKKIKRRNKLQPFRHLKNIIRLYCLAFSVIFSFSHDKVKRETAKIREKTHVVWQKTRLHLITAGLFILKLILWFLFLILALVRRVATLGRSLVRIGQKVLAGTAKLFWLASGKAKRKLRYCRNFLPYHFTRGVTFYFVGKKAAKKNIRLSLRLLATGLKKTGCGFRRVFDALSLCFDLAVNDLVKAVILFFKILQTAGRGTNTTFKALCLALGNGLKVALAFVGNTATLFNRIILVYFLFLVYLTKGFIFLGRKIKIFGRHVVNISRLYGWSIKIVAGLIKQFLENWFCKTQEKMLVNRVRMAGRLKNYRRLFSYRRNLIFCHLVRLYAGFYRVKKQSRLYSKKKIRLGFFLLIRLGKSAILKSQNSFVVFFHAARRAVKFARLKFVITFKTLGAIPALLGAAAGRLIKKIFHSFFFLGLTLNKILPGLLKFLKKITFLPFRPLMLFLNYGKKKIKAFLRRRQAKSAYGRSAAGKEEQEEVFQPPTIIKEKAVEVKTSAAVPLITIPEKKKVPVIPAILPKKKRVFSFIKLIKFILRLPFRLLMLVANFGKKKIKAYLKRQRQKDDFGEEKLPPARNKIGGGETAQAPQKPVEDEISAVTPLNAALVKLEPTIMEKPVTKPLPGNEIFPIKKDGIWQVSALTPPANVEKNRLMAPSEIGPGQRQTLKQRAASLLKDSLLTLRPGKRAAFIFLIVLTLGIFSFGIPRQIEDKFVNRPAVTEQEAKAPETKEEGSVLGEKKTSEVKKVSAGKKLTFGQLFGQFLAAIALFFGSLFFIYSIKYYLTIALVLLASQGINQGAKMGRLSGFFYRLFFKDANNGNGHGNGHNGAVGLLPNFQDDKPLSSYPFVCVQLPFYNEKKVANRILTACTSFDYPNYEVVVADDSTDETVKILGQWQHHPRVKILHRQDRSGFKGGALREAMKIQDKRTEFVIVFDADFIPYPDTIRQFLKYFLVNGNGNGLRSYKDSNVAAVQGYQWHVLNKNENWITRSVRTEFSGSYVIERPGAELIGSLKQIAGSVYMIRADVLKAYNWTNSITEDFELTMRIYRDGWKVIFTPYIQAPAECVSTIKRLIRQRMRWAEGHTNNVRRYFWSILKSPYMSRREKAEFLYLAPYYLQSAFLLVGTACWFISDVLLHAQLPFWTDLWGWSLVFTNLFALPLLNGVGLFFEESDDRDYLGTFSFIALCYILAPFQALAALRGLFNKEGSWFRTPKSGHITDLYFRSRYRRWFKSLFPGRKKKGVKDRKPEIPYLKLATSHSTFQDFKVKKRKGAKKIANIASLLLIIATLALQFLSYRLPSDNPENLSGSQTKFLALNQAENRDNSFETKESDKLPAASIIAQTSPGKGKTTPVPQKETAKTPTSNIPAQTSPPSQPPENVKNPSAPIQISPSAPEKGPLDKIPVSNEENPNLVNSPNGPVVLIDNLPEKVKEAVKTAFQNWPEGKDEVELTSLRAEKSKQVLTKNGEIRQEIGIGPLHYADAEGLWQDINTAIKPVEGIQINSADTYQYANTTNTYKTYFKADETQPGYVKFEFRGQEISFSLPAAVSADIMPAVENNIITYPEVYPGVDLRYSVGLNGVLEEYIVKTREALANLPVITQAFSAPNANFSQEGDNLQFRDSLAGAKLWHFPKPVIYELNNQDAKNYGLHRETEDQDDIILSKKILDQEGLDWLNDPQRQFPIVIDDSTVVDYTDTNYLDGHIIYNGSTYTKSESETGLKFGGSQTPEPDESYRGYIKFDITDLTEASYSQVDLSIYLTAGQSASDTTSIKAVPNEPGARAAADLWTDINGASVYVSASTSFRSATARSFNLGATALTDLNNALANDWFSVSFQSSNEITSFGAILSEDHGSAAYRPRLGAIYSVIDTSTKDAQATSRRTTFYDTTNGKYWAFGQDGSASYSYYSADGTTWTEDSNTFLTANGIEYAWWDQANGKVTVAFYRNADIKLRVGTVGATSITWGDEQTPLDGTAFGTNYYYLSSVARDSSNYCWVTASHYDGDWSIAIRQSSNTDCTTWNAVKDDADTDGALAYSTWPVVLPLDGGDVYVAWNGLDAGTTLFGLRWNGASWDALDTIDNSILASNTVNGVVDANYDIHLVYIDSNNDTAYRKYDSSVPSWSGKYVIHGGTDYQPNISFDTATNDIYVYYAQQDFGTAYANKIYYHKCDTDNDCTQAGNWTAQSNIVTGFYVNHICASYKESGRVWVVYNEGLYATEVTHILIPENVWLLIPFIAFLPKQIQKLIQRAKGRKKKKKSSFRLTSVFGIKKRK